MDIKFLKAEEYLKKNNAHIINYIEAFENIQLDKNNNYVFNQSYIDKLLYTRNLLFENYYCNNQLGCQFSINETELQYYKLILNTPNLFNIFKDSDTHLDEQNKILYIKNEFKNNF
jgi:hypothetical protein